MKIQFLQSDSHLVEILIYFKESRVFPKMTRFIFGIKKYLFHPTLICILQIFSQCFIPYIFAQSCIFCENFVRDHTF